MNDCPNGDVRDLLPAYLNDRLSAAQRTEVEAHLTSCDDCRAELGLLRDLRATMRHAPAVDVDSIAAAIPPYRAPVRRSSAMGWRAAAAVVVIAAGGTSIALLRDAGDRPARTEPMAVVSAPVATARDSTIVAITTTPPASASRDSMHSSEASSPAASRELAVGSSAIGELSDRELGALVAGLESLDALPSTELEGADAASLVREESR